MKRMLAAKVEELKNVLAAMDKKDDDAKSGVATKFTTFKMNTGSVDNYHEGLEKALGDGCTSAELSIPPRYHKSIFSVCNFKCLPVSDSPA